MKKLIPVAAIALIGVPLAWPYLAGVSQEIEIEPVVPPAPVEIERPSPERCSVGERSPTEECTREKTITPTRRLRISFSAGSPKEIVIAEGDTVAAGSVLVESSDRRSRLLARKEQLLASRQKVAFELPPVPALPVPNFAAENSAISLARAQLGQARALLATAPQLRFKDPEIGAVLDADRIRERSRIQQSVAVAQTRVDMAVAELEAARSRHEEQKWEYKKTFQEREERLRQQGLELDRLDAQLTEINRQLEETTQVKAPYAGSIQRVRITGQNQGQLQGWITLAVAEEQG